MLVLRVVMPRVGLNREKLIATATAIADESGLASVSLHSLARHYGVAAPSMYKHVKNLEDLQRAIAHEALVLFERALLSSKGSVTELATAYRKFAASHPGLYETTQLPHLFASPESKELSNRVVSHIAQVLPENLSSDDLIHQVRIVRSALHGFVSLERSGGFGLPKSLDRSFDELCTALTVMTTLSGVSKKAQAQR